VSRAVKPTKGYVACLTRGCSVSAEVRAENLMESVCFSPYVLRTADTGYWFGTRAYNGPVSIVLFEPHRYIARAD
jgi:hypothetical protein